MKQTVGIAPDLFEVSPHAVAAIVRCWLVVPPILATGNSIRNGDEKMGCGQIGSDAGRSFGATRNSPLIHSQTIGCTTGT